MEKIESLMSLYKKDKITDYVIERELSVFMGSDTTIMFSDDLKAANTSFVIFTLPERRVEGLHITYILDRNALLNFYNDAEVEIILERLKSIKQDIYKKYMNFIKEGHNKDISLNYALGFLLELYESYRSKLIIDTDNFLPAEDELLKYIDRFNLEEADKNDIESLLISQIICQEVVDFAKKYVKISEGEVKIKVVDYSMELPQISFCQQEIRKCTNAEYIVHQDIDYNYKPETNQ